MNDANNQRAEVTRLLATIEDDPALAGRLLRNLGLAGWETHASAGAGSPRGGGSIQEAMVRLLRLLMDRTGTGHAFCCFGGGSEGAPFAWARGFENPTEGAAWVQDHWPTIREAIHEGADHAAPCELPGGDGAPVPGRLEAAPIVACEAVIGMVGVAWTGDGPEEAGRHRSPIRSAAFLLGQTLTEIWEKNRNQSILYSMIQSLAAALDARDAYTRGHSDRVAMYSMAVLNELGLDEGGDSPLGLRDQLRLGALLHDIGKVGIPDAVLLKPGKLTLEERTAIKEHPLLGAEIVRSSGNLDHIVPGVLFHHERLDGSGYPMGLVGDEIPLVARILGIADVFDALTSGRPYRQGLSHTDAIDIIRKGAGTEFDPEIVEALVRACRKSALTSVRIKPAVTTGHIAREAARIDRERPGLADRVPSVPIVLHRVNELIRDPDSSVVDIARVIATDEGLVVRLLKVANSAFYALPGRVGTIPMAITLLGLTTLRNIVIGTAMSDVARVFLGSSEESLHLWDHGLRVAVWGRALARRFGGADPEEAFTAGLLHDVGKGIVLRELPASQAHLRSLLLDRPDCRVLERQAVGFDHGQLGAWALRRWRLPEPLVNTVRYHHEPRAGEEASPSALLWVIHLADVLGHVDAGPDEAVHEAVTRFADPFVWHHLPLGDGAAIREMLPRVREDLEVARGIYSDNSHAVR